MPITPALPALLSPEPMLALPPSGQAAAGFAALLAQASSTTPSLAGVPVPCAVDAEGQPAPEAGSADSADVPVDESPGESLDLPVADPANLAMAASLAGLASALAARGTAVATGSASGPATSPVGDARSRSVTVAAAETASTAPAEAGTRTPAADSRTASPEAQGLPTTVLTPTPPAAAEKPEATRHAGQPDPVSAVRPSDSTPAVGVLPQSTAPEAPSTESTSPVVRQIVPELTRMVARGDGTHRLWLKLNPDNLGEVRVVLTLRDGDVQVRIAGGTEAQQELVQRAPELHRLLAANGATHSMLELTDPAGRTLATSTNGDSTGLADGRAHHPQHSDQTSDRPARRQAGNDATDGTGDPTPLSDSSRPVGQARGNTGLDLTL